jgi:hypothetical protein
MALFALLQVPVTASGGLYLALSKPEIGAWLSLGAAVLTVPAVLAGVYTFGLPGAALAMLGVGCAYGAADLVIAKSLVRIRWSDLLHAVWRPLVALAIMHTAVSAVQNTFEVVDSARPAVLLALDVTSGVLVYLLSILALWRLAGSPEGGERLLLDYGQKLMTYSGAAFRRLLRQA